MPKADGTAEKIWITMESLLHRCSDFLRFGIVEMKMSQGLRFYKYSDWEARTFFICAMSPLL